MPVTFVEFILDDQNKEEVAGNLHYNIWMGLRDDLVWEALPAPNICL